jgi:hypothetical protein
MRKDPNRSSEAISEGPYLENHNLSTPPLTPERRSRHRTNGRRSLIANNTISIAGKPTKKRLPNPNINY